MFALIDADLIVYSVGFASDKNNYRIGGLDFSTKKEAIAFAKSIDMPVEEIIKTVTPEPLEYCLHSVKELINSILKETGAIDYRLFLTGDGNFREEVAITKPYKGNRDDLHKPIYYKEIKKYLIDVWQAEVVEGMEADDKIGVHQYNYGIDLSDTIICSLDKDMNMIPGWHYNWRKKEKYWISEKEADYNFYYQMLTGDTTDNIQGVPKIGPKKAEKILAGKTNKQMSDAVEEQYWIGYYNHIFNKDIKLLLENIDNIIQEHAKLLWIRREDTTIIPLMEI